MFMAETLPFNREDLNKINTNLLVSILAQQQVLFDVLFQDHAVSRDQMLKEIAEKHRGIVEYLYTQFGMTPDVLLPPKD
jgi:hypothetical protein